MNEHLEWHSDFVWVCLIGNCPTTKWPDKTTVIQIWSKPGCTPYFDHVQLPQRKIRNNGRKRIVQGRNVIDRAFGTNDSERQWGYPTQKPPFLADLLIRVHVPAGEPHLIVDPFCGSSSTDVAALNLGHRYLGFDQCEKAAQLSVRRCRDQQVPQIQ